MEIINNVPRQLAILNTINDLEICGFSDGYCVDCFDCLCLAGDG